MAGLFDQFIIEARELLDLADAGLLQLERNPDDQAAVTELFRALHTLKGATGLFDLPVFTRLMHVGEDALMLVRAGKVVLTPDLADRLFHMLDLSRGWITLLELDSALPPGADTVAAEQESLLRQLLGKPVEPTTGPEPEEADVDWLASPTPAEQAAMANATVSGQALSAIRYDPRPDCFYVGDDPLDLFRRIPGLLTLRIEPVGEWPALSQLDPYLCQLRFRALSSAPVDVVAGYFRAVPDQSAIRALPVQAAVPEVMVVRTDPVDAVLRTQLEILALPGTVEEVAARRAAVRRVLGNSLTALELAGLRVPDEDSSDALSMLITAMIAGIATDTVPADLAAAVIPDPVQGKGSGDPAGRRSLRVDADRMDRLMDLVGELVGAKARLPFLAREVARSGHLELAQGLKESQGQIDAITSALQDAVLRLRTLPLDRVFSSLPRLVRDIVRKLGKQVDFQIRGGDTEADKDILDALGDPLLHLLRNALDHGLELPEQRVAAGKPPVASLTLTAFQDRDGVVIEIADDGRGIDPDLLRARVVAQGMLPEEQARQLGDAEALRLIFMPGFSTADRVTELSGRGVGMDAVKSAIERAGGRVDIVSTPREGTVVRLYLPLTMMVTRVLVLELAGVLYGVPVAQVIAMHWVRDADIRKVKNLESVVIGDALLPLIRLRDRLELPPRRRMPAKGIAGEAVLVVDLAGQLAALVVDDFRERADVVLKPMSGVLARLRGFSGTASMGDGGLLLVLNLHDLV